MRTISFFFVLTFVIGSCKKSGYSRDDLPAPVPVQVKVYLKTTLNQVDYDQLNFNMAVLTDYDSGLVRLWRVPSAKKPISTDFVMVQTDGQDSCLAGRIVHLEQTSGKSPLFNGSVVISSLNRKQVLSSAIANGFVVDWHQASSSTVATGAGSQIVSIPASDGAEVLPDVLVVGYVSQETGGISLSTYMRLLTIIASSPDGAAGTGGGGGYGTSGPISPVGERMSNGGNLYSPLDPNAAGASKVPIKIDVENGPDMPAISLAQFINCFSLIADDANTTYSITLMSDLPVDTDPNKLFNLGAISPGHVFLQLTKANGGHSVTQNIGFYPNAPWYRTAFGGPVAGKFVDNAYHEYNASLVMPVTGPKFQNALNSLVSAAGSTYDLDEHNCTDVALQVFNAGRTGTPLTVPLYHIPLSPLSGSNTPQGLYFELDFMKKSKTPEAMNISTGSAKNYTGSSHGACN